MWTTNYFQICFLLFLVSLSFCESKQKLTQKERNLLTSKKDNFLNLQIKPLENLTWKTQNPDSIKNENLKKREMITDFTLFSNFFCNTSGSFSLCESGSAPFQTKNSQSYQTHIVYNEKLDEFYSVFIQDENGDSSLFGARISSTGKIISTTNLFPKTRFTVNKRSPRLAIDSNHNRYLLVFEYGLYDENHSQALVVAFITFDGTLITYSFMGNKNELGFSRIDAKYDSIKDLYVIVFEIAAFNSSSIGFLQVNTSSFQLIKSMMIDSGFPDSAPHLAISGDSKLYIIVMETKFNEQNDLLLIGLDSFYLSLIYAHVLTWQLDNTNAIYEIDEKYPRILFVPVIDKFLLVAEAYVANISFNEIAISLINYDLTYYGDLVGLTNSYEGKIHQNPQMTLLPGTKAAAVYEESSSTENVIGFTTFDLLTKEIFEEKILSDTSKNSYHPSVAYNTNDQRFLILWETVNNYDSSSSSSNQGLTRGAVIAILLVFIFGGCTLVIVGIAFVLKKFTKKSSVAYRPLVNEEEGAEEEGKEEENKFSVN